MSATVTDQGGLTQAQVAARVDRLPITWLQWRILLVLQLCWGLVVGAVDGMPARIYPYIWLPKHQISPHQFTWLVAFDFGVGIFLGEYLGGYLGDRIGRKPTLLLAPVVAAVFIMPTAFTHSFTLLMIFYTLSNMSVGFYLASNVALMTEVVGPKSRGRMLFTCQAVAWIGLALVAAEISKYMIPGHYIAYVAVMAAIPLGVALPLLMWLVPESPRWLAVKGRGRDAEVIVDRFEKETLRYKGELPEPDMGLYRSADAPAEKMAAKELFRGPYAKQTILILVCWFVGYTGIVFGFGSYSLTFFALKGWGASANFNRTLINAIVGGGGALLLAGLLNERLERKTIIFWSSALFGASVILTRFYVTNHAAGYILSTAAGAGAGLWLFAMYNYNTALYPTRIRSVATGWSDGVGHLGGIIGLVPVGYLFTGTAPSYLIWFLYVGIIGGFVPGLLLYGLGVRQKGVVLEEMERRNLEQIVVDGTLDVRTPPAGGGAAPAEVGAEAELP